MIMIQSRFFSSAGFTVRAALLGVFLATLSVESRLVPITILHTTDLHGHVWPARDYDGTEGLGGLLRVATVIEQLREANPDALLVDAGDLYQGGMESYLTRGRIMNDALAWLDFDAWVLGNHEFDWGIDVLSSAVEGSRVPVLGANVSVRPGAANPLARVRPFVVRDVDGVRVALVGLSTEAIPNWSRPHLLGDVVFIDSVESLRSVMPAVRAQRPDVLVLVVHQGYRPFGDNPANQINRIARNFPEFDLIIGGHSHQPIEHVLVNGVLYTQAGYYGIWLGKATLVYDTVARRVVDRRAELIHVADQFPEHEGLREALKADLDRARREAALERGHLTEALLASSRVPGQSGVQQLLARAIAEAAGAEVVLHGTLGRETLSEGMVTERDIWRIVPYENTIGVLLLTASELRSILEENADLTGSSQFMGVYGLRYEMHAYAAPGERVQALRRADGSHIHPRTRLRVAMNSYVLASGGLRFPSARRLADDPVTRLDMTGIDTRAAVRNYVRRNSPVAIPDEEWVQWFRAEP